MYKKSMELLKDNASNPKLWLVIGVGVAGVVILAETNRRRLRTISFKRLDFGAFIERFELHPFPQPAPPAAKLKLSGLAFAIKDVYISHSRLIVLSYSFGFFCGFCLFGITVLHKRKEVQFFLVISCGVLLYFVVNLIIYFCLDLKFDSFDVNGYVTGFGNPDWKRTHAEAEKTAVLVTALLKSGATCVGKTVMDELALGITGENVHYGTPTNPQVPSCIPGGSSSGSAVAVAAELVDFAIGTDTVGCVRIPASFCGIFGFRSSQGAVSMIGVLPNSQSLDTIGWFARDPSILHRVGHVLLQANSVETKRTRRLIFADDLFQFAVAPARKGIYTVKRAIENLPGYQTPKHMSISQYIAANVPRLKEFCETSTKEQNGLSILKALSTVMLSLQSYEFRTNHEEWVKSVKPKLGREVSNRVLAALNTEQDNIKMLYKVRTEIRGAFQNLLKDDGILVLPTVAETPLKFGSKKAISVQFQDRMFAISSISSMSGCCEVTIPLGKLSEWPFSVSFISFHGADKYLLDTVLDMYSSLKEQVSNISNGFPPEDTNGNLETSDLLKEKGNAAFQGRQWSKAVNYYSEAIKLNGTSATYYCNRAAAYLELGCFQQAEEDCNKAVSLDKKNIKAYLRRGTARESLLFYKEAADDFKHALVLEPQNKFASRAEKRLRRLIC